MCTLFQYNVSDRIHHKKSLLRVQLNAMLRTHFVICISPHIFFTLNKATRIFTYIITSLLSLFLKDEKNGCSNFKIIPIRIVRKSSYSLA